MVCHLFSCPFCFVCALKQKTGKDGCFMCSVYSVWLLILVASPHPGPRVWLSSKHQDFFFVVVVVMGAVYIWMNRKRNRNWVKKMFCIINVLTFRLTLQPPYLGRGALYFHKFILLANFPRNASKQFRYGNLSDLTYCQNSVVSLHIELIHMALFCMWCYERSSIL